MSESVRERQREEMGINECPQPRWVEKKRIALQQLEWAAENLRFVYQHRSGNQGGLEHLASQLVFQLRNALEHGPCYPVIDVAHEFDRWNQENQ